MLTAVEPTKVCARCKQRKPYSAFSTRTRWEDGTPRTVIAYCRPCANAKRKENYRKHPESKGEACRRWREKVKQDPERVADYREKQRIYNRMWHLRHGYRVGRLTRIGGSPSVDAAPFVAWLQTLGTSSREIAEACGMADGTVRALLRGDRVSVYLDTVDAALLHANTLTTLDELYPLEDAA